MKKINYQIYKFMYKKMREQGTIRNAIFRIWYEIEWQRVNIKEWMKGA